MAIYDDPDFFADYAQMPRSQNGLAGAGEWPDFMRLLPDLTNKSVLDLGCGYGWQCRYAATHGATLVTGIDNSKKMLEQARQANFLGHTVTKYHHTLSTIIEAVLTNGMALNKLVEPQGEPTPVGQPLPEWQRIPQMLLIKATKA